MSDLKDLVIVGGPNGSGKTTFARNYLRLRPMIYLSADDIAARISPQQPERARIEAGREFIQRAHELIHAGKEFLIESTLSGRSLQRLIQEAKRHDYTIEIIFIFLESPNICLKRIRERVSRGGHDVPEEDVRRRFSRSKRNFWQIYRHEADYWHLFYNAESSLPTAALGRKGLCKSADEELLSIFLQDMESDR
ncbi:MAG TPA: AAA family ATPase [Thermoanaerobaculia bacterium]|nr:AAA family ATPase [Thermoanaerobaculia bacterium]